MRSLWEVLVPTVSNEGKPYRTRYHRVWDAKVREISGGLTVMPVVKGQWVSGDGRVFAERMIPVRFLATRDQAELVAGMTLKYYDQMAVLCYKVTDDFIMKEKT